MGEVAGWNKEILIMKSLCEKKYFSALYSPKLQLQDFGCRQKSSKWVWRCNGHLWSVFCQSCQSANDKGDNEVKSGAVHRYPDIYLTKSRKTSARRQSMKAVRPIITSNGINWFKLSRPVLWIVFCLTGLEDRGLMLRCFPAICVRHLQEWSFRHSSAVGGKESDSNAVFFLLPAARR